MDCDPGKDNIDVLIGTATSDHVLLKIQLPTISADTFQTQIEAQCGPFFGTVSTFLFWREITDWIEAIRNLHRTLSGSAALDAREGHLRLTLEGDGFGHIDVRGRVQAETHKNVSLDFDFSIDQTFLPKIVAALLKVTPA